jgi:hypothetical protein
MGITCATGAGMPDERSFGAGKVAGGGENGVEGEDYQEGDDEDKGSES